MDNDSTTTEIGISDGSDGYEPGTYYWSVTRAGCESRDGGYSSREHAAERAAKVAREIESAG